MKPPLVKGGQGRSSADLVGDARALLTLSALALLLLLLWLGS